MAEETDSQTPTDSPTRLPASAGSDLARVLIMHAVNAVLAHCGNSYVNAYTEQWLDWAKQLGAYHGPVIGTVKDVSEQWDQWLDENGGLPDIPDSPHWLVRMPRGQNDPTLPTEGAAQDS